MYIFTFYGISATYLMQFPFTFKNTSAQFGYRDETNFFRARISILENGKKLQINNQSVNMASNTALTAIEEVS